MYRFDVYCTKSHKGYGDELHSIRMGRAMSSTGVRSVPFTEQDGDGS